MTNGFDFTQTLEQLNELSADALLEQMAYLDDLIDPFFERYSVFDPPEGEKPISEEQLSFLRTLVEHKSLEVLKRALGVIYKVDFEKRMSIYIGLHRLNKNPDFKPEAKVEGQSPFLENAPEAVSYTHLTLPTNREV